MGITITGPDPSAPQWPVKLLVGDVLTAPGGYDVVGAADTPAGISTVMADSSDATYVRQSIAVDLFRMKAQSYSIPPGARVTSMYMQGRVSAVETPTHPNRVVSYAIGDMTGPGGTRKQNPPPNFIFINSPITTQTSPGRSNLANGGVITQADLERGIYAEFGLHTSYGLSNGSVIRWYDAWLSLHYDMAPTAVITTPSGVWDVSPSPQVSWDYSDDFKPQIAYRVQILNASSVVVYDSGIIQSSETVHQVTENLTNGSYTAQVLVYQEEVGPVQGAFPAKNWATSAFTIDLFKIGAPTISTSQVNEHIDIGLDLNVNLLNFDQSTFDNGPWDWTALTAVTISQETTIVKSGTRALKGTMTAASSQTGLASRVVPAVAGGVYAAGAFMRPGTGSRNMSMGLTYFDSVGTQLATASTTVSVASGSWATRVTHKSTAPANTAYVRPLVTVAGANTEVFYVDEAGIWKLDAIGDPVPTWSRGGFHHPSLNVLSADDSTFEGSGTTWVATSAGGTWVRSTTQARRGINSARLMKTTAGAGDVVARLGSTTFATVFQDRWWLVWSIYSAAVRTVGMRLVWYDAAGAVLSTGTITTTSTLNAWKEVSGQVIAPANTASMTVEKFVMAAAQNEAHYFDAVSVYESNPLAGYQPGYYPSTDPHPTLFVEYTKDNGVTWVPLLSQAIDQTSSSMAVQDYEIPSGQVRKYRAKLATTENGVALDSDWATSGNSSIVLKQAWLHAANDAAGTSKQFIYDGHGRSEDMNQNAELVRVEGRMYPFAEFSASESGQLKAEIKLDNDADKADLDAIFHAGSEVVFRDQRGRGVRGVMNLSYEDEWWGYSASVNIQFSGEQPGRV